MLKILHETQIFGPSSVYSYYSLADKLLLEAKENYQKKSHRNRYKILGPNGIITLSIPLQKGKNQKTSIKDVKISYAESWITNHIHTLQSCYGSAPYFLFYSEQIFDILSKKYTYLWDLNLELLSAMISFLNIEIRITYTDDYQDQYPSVQDLRNLFKINQLEDFPNLPYVQVFEAKHGFISGLSVLDLLFCTGPEAINFLTSTK